MTRRSILAAALLALLVAPAASAGTMTLRIEARSAEARVGDLVTLNTTLANEGNATAPPTLVFLSIVDVSQGVPMDLEDWTAKRSETVGSLAPGGQATQTWTLRAIAQGDYAVQVIAMENGTTASGVTAISPTLHLHVAQRTNLNPGGVLPVVLGVPVGIVALLGGAFALRRRASGGRSS